MEEKKGNLLFVPAGASCFVLVDNGRILATVLYNIPY